MSEEIDEDLCPHGKWMYESNMQYPINCLECVRDRSKHKVVERYKPDWVEVCSHGFDADNVKNCSKCQLNYLDLCVQKLDIKLPKDIKVIIFDLVKVKPMSNHWIINPFFTNCSYCNHTYIYYEEPGNETSGDLHKTCLHTKSLESDWYYFYGHTTVDGDKHGISILYDVWYLNQEFSLDNLYPFFKNDEFYICDTCIEGMEKSGEIILCVEY